MAVTPGHRIAGVRPCSPARVLPNPPDVVRRVFSSGGTSSMAKPGTSCTNSSPLIGATFGQANRGALTMPQLLSNPARSYAPVRSSSVGADAQPARIIEGADCVLGGSSLRASSSTGSCIAVHRLSPRRPSGATEFSASLSENGALRTGSPRRVVPTKNSLAHINGSDQLAWQDLPTMPMLPVRRGSSLCAPPKVESVGSQVIRRGSSLCAPPNIELSSGSSASAQLRMASTAPQLPPNIVVLAGKVVPLSGSVEQSYAPQPAECEPSTERTTELDATDIATLPIGAWTFNMAEALQKAAPPTALVARRSTEVVPQYSGGFILAEPSPSFGETSPLATSPVPPTPAFAATNWEGPASYDVMSARVRNAATTFDNTYCEQDLICAPGAEEALALVAESPPLIESESTLPAALAGEQDTDAMSESSVEVLPGTTDTSQGAYICEVGITGAELGPLLDIRAFHSAVSFTNFYQTNADVVSEKPHRFVVHTKEDLADNFVQVVLHPRDDESSVTLELEAYFPLSYIVEQVGYGEVHTVTLCLLPRGSGAAPATIFRHCAGLAADTELGGGSMSTIMLTCSVQERPGSLWRSDPELEVLPSDHPRFTTSKIVTEGSCDSQAQHCPQHLPPVPAAITQDLAEDPGNLGDSELVSQQQEWVPEQQQCEADTPRSQCQPEGQPVSSPMTDGWDEEQEQMWLHEELKRARNELRMQQTLMNFQERRLQVFEAQSNAVAAANTASQAYDANRNQALEPHANLHGVQEQIRYLGDQIHTQQEEISRLREQLQVQHQQEEISRLREQLSLQQPGYSFSERRQLPILPEQRFQPHRQHFADPPERLPQVPTQLQHPSHHQAMLDRRADVEKALIESHERMRHEVEAREFRIAELERLLQERNQQLDMIPDAVESILRSPPPLHALEAPPQRPNLYLRELRTTPTERSPVKPWEALPRHMEASFKNGEGDQSSRLSHYSPRPGSSGDGAAPHQSLERSSYFQGALGSLPPPPQIPILSARGNSLDAPSTDRSGQQDCIVRAYRGRSETITDNSPGHHPSWESLLQDNVQMKRRSTHFKGNVVNEFTLQPDSPNTLRILDAPASQKSDRFADDFGITPCPTAATLALPSCHFLGDDAMTLHRPPAPAGEANFREVSAFPSQVATTDDVTAMGTAARASPLGRNVTFHDSVCLPDDEQFFKRRSTTPVSASLDVSESRRSTVMMKPATNDAVVLGEHATLTPEVQIDMLQYTPEDPTDMLDAILAECIAYLQIPKTALGNASISRVSSGIYRLGPYTLRLKQLDGGIYMQQGPQEQHREFGDWLLDEARRNMHHLTSSGPQGSSGGTSSNAPELPWEIESKDGQQLERFDNSCSATGQRQRSDTACSSVSHAQQRQRFDTICSLVPQDAAWVSQPPRLSPQNAEPLLSHRSGVSDSPASAKRSLNFFQSPDGISFPKCANIELDIQIDIAPDSTGTTGTTMDFQGPSSPTASSVDVSGRSE